MTKTILTTNPDTFVWFEKYRPRKLVDCILPEGVKYLNELVKGDSLPHLIFHGPPGCGKTTAARALCEEMGLNHLFINASEERGIDTLRVKIVGYATTVSLTGGKKVIILDEADNLTQDAQLALRGVMEQYVENCTFILTANYPKKLLDAIHSRASTLNFTPVKDEIPRLSVRFLKRICQILDDEGVAYQKDVVAKLVSYEFPDYRRILNTLQRHATASGNKIDTSVLVVSNDVSLERLVSYLRDKDFSKMRRWVAESVDLDHSQFYSTLYKKLVDYLDGSTVPAAVIILNKYQVQAAFVADQELNLAACLTEIMADCEVK